MILCLSVQAQSALIAQVVGKGYMTDTLSIEEVLTRGDEVGLRLHLCASKVTLCLVCHGNFSGIDEFSGEWIELQYADHYADTAYRQIWDGLVRLKQENGMGEGDFWMYFKPGGLVLLQPEQRQLVLIRFNFCAMPYRVKRLTALFKADKTFAKATRVHCGAGEFIELHP